MINFARSAAYAQLSKLCPVNGTAPAKVGGQQDVEAAFKSLRQIASNKKDTQEAQRAIEILLNCAAAKQSSSSPPAGLGGSRTLADRAVEVLQELHDNTSRKVPEQTRAEIRQQAARLKALVESAQQPRSERPSVPGEGPRKSISEGFVRDLSVPPSILPLVVKSNGKVSPTKPDDGSLTDRKHISRSNAPNSGRPLSPGAEFPQVNAGNNVQLHHMKVAQERPLSITDKPSDEEALALKAGVEKLVAHSASPDGARKPSVMVLNVRDHKGEPVQSVAIVAVPSLDGKAGSCRTRTDFAVLTHGVLEGSRHFLFNLSQLLRNAAKNSQATIEHAKAGRCAQDSRQFHDNVCGAIAALDADLVANPAHCHTVGEIREILQDHFRPAMTDASEYPVGAPVADVHSSNSLSNVVPPVNTENHRA